MSPSSKPTAPSSHSGSPTPTPAHGPCPDDQVCYAPEFRTRFPNAVFDQLYDPNTDFQHAESLFAIAEGARMHVETVVRTLIRTRAHYAATDPDATPTQAGIVNAAFPAIHTSKIARWERTRVMPRQTGDFVTAALELLVRLAGPVSVADVMEIRAEAQTAVGWYTKTARRRHGADDGTVSAAAAFRAGVSPVLDDLSVRPDGDDTFGKGESSDEPWQVDDGPAVAILFVYLLIVALEDFVAASEGVENTGRFTDDPRAERVHAVFVDKVAAQEPVWTRK